MNIKTLFDLQETLKKKDKLIEFSKTTKLPEQYLKVPQREVNSSQPKPNKFEDFTGINANTLEKLKKAGCIYISFGVESGSQRILDEALNKGTSLQQATHAFEICKDVEIISMASLMIGSPGDTRETIQETISFI